VQLPAKQHELAERLAIVAVEIGDGLEVIGPMSSDPRRKKDKRNIGEGLLQRVYMLGDRRSVVRAAVENDIEIHGR
jgi:hypothetical protein